MINNPTANELAGLIGRESGICVSILMGTHESGRETTQNPIRFRNLITEAIEKVGDGDAKLRDRLQELAKLGHNFEFWQNQSAGFALFATGDFDQQFNLSHSPDETVHVAEHFYTLPIASTSGGCGSTRVLALSWNRARLFSCDGHRVHEISDDSFPVDFEDLVTERDAEKQLQFLTHSTRGGGASGPGTGSTAMYHGHGEGEDKIEADREMYLTRVGRMIAEEVYNTNHALVVLATEEVAGHFTSATNVDVAEFVHASPDGLDDQDLQRRMIESSKTLLKKSNDEITEKLGTAIANDAGSKCIEEIVLQSANGRVDTLVLGKLQPQIGSFDRDSRTVQLDENGDTDLVNVAVRETLQAGGSVVRIDDDADCCVAAIYRF